MRTITVIFKERIEAFSSLSPFFLRYPDFEKQYRNQIETIFSRKKENLFEGDDFFIFRHILNVDIVKFDLLNLLKLLRGKNDV